MTEELIKLVEELFPNLGPDKVKSIKELIREQQEKKYPWLATTCLNELSQGDILTNIPFFRVTEEGKVLKGDFSAILLSNTCDAQRNEKLIFAPLFDVETSNKIKDVNLAFNKLHFESVGLMDKYIDFDFISSIERKVMMKLIESRKVEKKYSLSREGYYFFILKLTMYFLRPESKEVIREEAN